MEILGAVKKTQDVRFDAGESSRYRRRARLSAEPLPLPLA
jgi:hypothetical protein